MKDFGLGDVRVSYPDNYRPTDAGPPQVSRSRGSAGPRMPDPQEIDAAIDELLETGQLHRVHEFTLARSGGVGPTRSAEQTERSARVEVETGPGESAAVLVNKDGVYSWVFPSGMAGARRKTRRAMLDEPSTLVFEIPLVEGGDSSSRGLFDVGEAVVGWAKAKVLKIAAGAAVGVAMRVLERGVEPGLVLVEGDDPDQWSRVSDFTQITLPEDRQPRILLLVHGTFSSTLGSFRGLGASSWGKQLLRDLHDKYDAIVGFDHYTLSDDPDGNALDLLRRLEAHPWNHGLAIDGIAYSRGALVLRSLVENLLPHSPLASNDAPARFETGIFVGGTNAGTALAEPENWHALIDLYTNLAVGAARVMALLPGGPAVPTLVGEALGGLADFAKYLATEAIDRNGIPGLAAMDPNGDFVRRINQTQPDQPGADEVRYHAVTSDFEPGRRAGGILDELPKRLMLAAADKVVDHVMGEDNDLVVNTSSMVAIDHPSSGLVQGTLEFGRNGHVYHLVYFTQRELDVAVRRWLGLEASRGTTARAEPDAIPQYEAKLRDVPSVRSGAPAATPAAAIPTRPTLKIEVVWGDIAASVGDVLAVGHYRGVLPQAAELAIDRAVSGADDGVLTKMTRRNLLRGDLGDVAFFPLAEDDGRLVAVCGMGFQGSFGAGSLRSLHRNLAWSVMSLPGEREISTVLIGAGTGNLNTLDAVRGLLVGFADSLRSTRHTIPLLRIVEFNKARADEVYDMLAAAELDWPVVVDLQGPGSYAGVGGGIDDTMCLDALLRGMAKAGDDGSYEAVRAVIPRNLTGRKRVLERLEQIRSDVGDDGGPGGVEKKSLAEMISQLTGRSATKDADQTDRHASDRIAYYTSDANIRASAIADGGSTVPERILRLDPMLLSDAARQMTDPDKESIPELATLLHGLAVPRDFRDFIRSQKNPLIVEVDRTTAPVHWEMLATESSKERLAGDTTAASIGLVRPVARQLRTTYSPPPAWRRGPGGRKLRALIIGDPGDPAKGENLSGARHEAKVISRILGDVPRFEEVFTLIGAPDADGKPTELGYQPATRIDVLGILINEDIDLIHYSGHGDYDAGNPSKSGWLFSGGMLTAGEISRIDRVPPMVVANACLTSQVARTNATTRVEGRYEAGLLPSLADEFLRRGVVNYIGTAWNVNDQGAVMFAKEFYRRFLDDASIGSALLETRNKLNERTDALWAAYQHYGDPFFTISDL